ncbi:MAG: GAF domain-containing protein [Anaerolineaceae bacterium]|nr:GAF domain-containing protein [Anaerolineaceae bacterium]
MSEDSLSQRLIESQRLLGISQMLTSATELSVVLQEIVDAAVSLIKRTDTAVLHLLNEEGSRLQAAAIAPRPNNNPHHHVIPAIPPEHRTRRSRLNFKAGQGVAGLVLQTGQSINIANAPEDPRYIVPQNQNNLIVSLLVIPVKTEEIMLGTLSLYSSRVGVFTSDDERLLSILSSHATVAIQKAQLLATERDQRRLAEALRNISLELSKTLDTDKILDSLLDYIHPVIPFDTAELLMVEQLYARPVRVMGYEKYGEEVQLAASQYRVEIDRVPVLRSMFRTHRPQVIPDTQAQPVQFGGEKMPATLSWAGAPIMAQNEVNAFLTLHIHDPEIGRYRPEHADRLAAFTGQVSLALENAWLFENVQIRLKEVDIMYRISQGISGSLEVDRVLYQLVNLLQDAFSYYQVNVYLIDPDTGDLVMRQGSGAIGNLLKQKGHRLKANTGIVGHVAATGQLLLSNDVETTTLFIPNSALPETRSELALPLHTGKRVLGVLDIQSDKLYAFTEQDLQLLLTIADQVAIAVQKGNLYAELQASLQQEQSTRRQLVQAEKLSSLGRIVASVAHELNNPLQAIHNLIYLVTKEEKLSAQAQNDLQTALEEANRMAELISRLKDIYHPMIQEQFQLETINTLISEVQKLIDTHLRHNNIEFEFNEGASLPLIPMIRDQIKQVILNICLNAVETMPDGGHLAITTASVASTHQVLLTIQDSGPGIPENVLPNIFDPFVTTKEGGTGLGLAITYDIVQRHAGKIEVESSLGQGSKFKVWLPVARQGADFNNFIS